MSSPSSRIRPLGRLDQPVDHPQHRGLAAAGRADQHHQLARRHLAGTARPTATVPSSYRLPTPSSVIVAAVADGRGTVHVCPSWPVSPGRRPGGPIRGSPGATSRDNSDTILAALRDHVTVTARGGAASRSLVALPLAVLAYWFRPLAGADPRQSPGCSTRSRRWPCSRSWRRSPVSPAPRRSSSGWCCTRCCSSSATRSPGCSRCRPRCVDAAEGMGYGRFGRLFRVELPLALPGIITGIRLATVSTVALVTVGVRARPGRSRPADLQRASSNNFYKAEIITGTLLCVALGLVLDLMLAGISRCSPRGRGGGRARDELHPQRRSCGSTTR